MQYAVLMQQYGEGCDYTIACGKDWRIIAADSPQHALEILVEELWESDHTNDGEQWLEAFHLYEIGDDHGALFFDWVTNNKADEMIARTDADKAARRAQYDELKEEFDR